MNYTSSYFEKEDHFTELSSITSIQDLDRISNLQLETMIEEGGLDLLANACFSSQLSPIIAHLQAFKQRLASLAEENLNLKKEFDSKKKECVNKIEEWKVLNENLSKNTLAFSNKCTESYNTQTMLDNLRVAVMESEERSDVTAEKFINGEINSEEFIKDFVQQKTLYHKRKSKEEKLFSSTTFNS